MTNETNKIEGLWNTLISYAMAIITVNLDNNEYDINYSKKKDYFRIPDKGYYDEDFYPLLMGIFDRCNLKHITKAHVKTLFMRKYLKACVSTGRTDFTEEFEGEHNGVKGKLSVRFMMDSGEEESNNIYIIFKIIHIDESNKMKISKIWDRVDDFYFIHEINLTNWRVTMIKYPELYLQDFVDIEMDFDDVAKLYSQKFVAIEDYENFSSKLEKDKIIDVLQKNNGEYKFNIRFMRENKRLEWYEVAITMAHEYKDKAIITVSNINDNINEKLINLVESKIFDESYLAVAYINLTRETFKLIKSNFYDATEEFLDLKSAVRLFSKDMLPDTADFYNKTMNPDSLSNIIKKEGKVTYEYEDFVYMNKSKNVEITYMKIDFIENEECCVQLIRDIGDRYVSRKKIMLSDNMTLAAFDTMFSTVFTLNCRNRQYKVIKHDSKNSIELSSVGDINELLQAMSEMIHPEYKNKFIRMFSENRITDLIEENRKEYSFLYYKKALDGNYEWMKVQGMFIDNPLNDDKIVLVMIKSVDNEITDNQNARDLMVGTNALYYNIMAVDIDKESYKLFSYNEDTFESMNKSQKELEEIDKSIVHPDDWEEFNKHINIEHIRKIYFNGKSENIMIRIMKDDEYRWYEVNLVPYNGAFMERKKCFIGFKDVHEQYISQLAQQRKIEEALEKAQKANEAKSTFLFNMSHDIRTPMNAIMGYSELIEKKAYDGDIDFIKESIRKVRTSSKYMLNILNDILCMSSIERGKMTINNEPINFAIMLNSINNMTQIMADKKNMIYCFNTHGISDDIVLGDTIKIEQIYVNIISNAIKFTNEYGCVEVFVNRIISDKEGYYKYEFECRDNGIGIPADYLDKIFEPFIRVKCSGINSVDGTGLGLAITKKLVEMMDGDIEVCSEENVGTTFKVTLYFKIAEELYDSDVEEVLNNDISGARVLIVEDKRANYEVLRLMLEYEGIITQRAVNGKEAVDIVEASEENYYDIIFMDIQMPIMNGYDSCRNIKALDREDVKNMPIIAMTANAFKEDIENSKQAGMVEHLSKPIDRDKVINTVHRWYKKV